MRVGAPDAGAAASDDDDLVLEACDGGLPFGAINKCEFNNARSTMRDQQDAIVLRCSTG